VGDIAEGTLGTVPLAANAESAAYADSASIADSAYSAETAYTADTAYFADSASTADTAYSADTANSADTASSADTANTASSVEPNGVDAAAMQAGAVRADALGALRVRKQEGSVGPGSNAFVQVGCQAGEKLLGGGVFLDSATSGWEKDAHIVRSSPNPQGTGWQGGVYNSSSDTVSGPSIAYEVRALCLEG
jgi:hypothetical protein